MKLRSLLNGVPLTGGSVDLDMEITSISYDTRTLLPGGLFVALPGSREDGHNFLLRAFELGAAVVLCREPGSGSGPYVTCEDPRLALGLISANWFGHPGDELVLIGVTGTNGKTTTTHLIKAMLEGALQTKVGLIGTNRNMIGDLELPAHRTTPGSYELQQLLRRITVADLRLDQRRERPFSREELAVLFAAMLIEP